MIFIDLPEENVTPQAVQDVVERIGKFPTSYQNHDLEDELYEGVLRAIAAGQCSDPVACASIAIKTKDFPFPRYTA